MKSLKSIQKTFGVFKVLSKIAMILSFVWAGFTVIGLLCCIAWYSGGTVIGANQDMLLSMTLTDSLNQIVGVLLSDMVFALSDGMLFAYAFQYFKKEQVDGTPFTQKGAEQIKQLGIRTIVLPFVAAILSAIFYELFELSQATMVDWNNLASLSLGIVLILVSLIFHYGAEMEEQLGENNVVK